MPGPLPKPQGERRRYNQPARGEWVDLEAPSEPVLAPYDPSVMTVSARMWNAWRMCGPATQYGDEDREAIHELAVKWAELSFADQDRRMNALGLTPKGKRDLRWRTPNEVKTLKKAQQKAVTPLRVVTDKET